MRDFGIKDEESITEVGPNGKMNEFCAVMGLCNLNHVDEAIASRGRCAAEYRRLLQDSPSIRILRNEEDLVSNYAYFPVVTESREARDGACARLKEQGIFARKYFYPLTSDASCYRGRFEGSDLTVARSLAERVLTLPIYEGFATEDAARIAGILTEG